MINLAINFLNRLWKKDKKTHLWRKKIASKMVHDFQSNDMAPQRVFARIRSMDALAFEELILEAFETRGMPVKRSQRYTGDGGFDGQIMHKNKWVLLQMKRYKGAIAVSDVKAFAALCKRRKQTGFFIHSGKTTSGSKNIISGDPNLEVISGQRLVALLKGERVDFPKASQ